MGEGRGRSGVARFGPKVSISAKNAVPQKISAAIKKTCEPDNGEELALFL